ncbi:hypothetical protein ABBQ38_007805 [Trebouxia sp. C0009 RCD-2024]
MSSSTDQQFTIPPALPSILKGFARETLRAQPQDIYKFAAQYFTELHSTSSLQTQPGLAGDATANMQADLLQHFLDEDSANVGFLHRPGIVKALHAGTLALSDRQIQLAIANCNEDDEGMIDYHKESVDKANLVLMAQGMSTQPAAPVMLRGQTKSELEAAMTRACQEADPEDTGAISWQEFKTRMQSPELTLCVKDVNLLLGHVDSVDTVDFKSLIPKAYGLLSARLADELQVNEKLTSVQAFSKHLLQLMKEQDAQHSGTIPLAQLVTSLQALSQACIGLNNILLACVIGHACSSGSEDVQYDEWAPAAAAMLYSMLSPAMASVRLAAAEEFKGRGESEKTRSANLQAIQDCLQSAFQEADKANSESLPTQSCAMAVLSPATDTVKLTPQESIGLRSAILGDTVNGFNFTSERFQKLCSQLLVQMEQEEYIYSYIQVHT